MNDLKELLHKEGISVIIYSFAQEREVCLIQECLKHKYVKFTTIEEFTRKIKFEVLEGNKHFLIDNLDILSNNNNLTERNLIIESINELSFRMGLSIIFTAPINKNFHGGTVQTLITSPTKLMYISKLIIQPKELREKDKTFIITIHKNRYGQQGNFNCADSFPEIFRKLKIDKLDFI